MFVCVGSSSSHGFKGDCKGCVCQCSKTSIFVNVETGATHSTTSVYGKKTCVGGSCQAPGGCMASCKGLNQCNKDSEVTAKCSP
jgi:hypothetical protein